MAFSGTILWLGCLSLGLAPFVHSATESITTRAPKTTHETPAVDLGALLDAGEGDVVTLVAGQTRLAAHRAVLAARSPRFKAVLSNSTLEASSGQVEILDVEGPVLRQLVAYLYTLQAPQMSSMAPQLLAAADKYGVPGLKAACEQQLLAEMAVQNAVLAVRHNCPRLKEAAVAFIRANFFSVVATQAWARALVSHPKDMTDVIQLLAEPSAGTSTAADTDGRSTPKPQPHAGNNQTTVASTPATDDSSTSLPGAGAVSQYTTVADTDGRSSHEPQPHAGNSQTTVASTPATDDSRTSLPGSGAVSPYTTPAATDRGSTPGQTHSGSSQAAVACTPAPPACNASLPDDDTVSRYRGLSARAKGRRLIAAVTHGAAGEVRALLAAGADVGARDEEGTALHWAAWEGNVDVASCLLGCGAEVDARNWLQNTPLHWAAAWDRTAVVRLLAAASADLNAREWIGSTPLHVAASRGHAEAVAALLEAGADRGVKDSDGYTPLDVAANQQLRQLLTKS